MAVWGCWLGCNEIGDCGNEVAMSTAPIEWPLVVCGGLGGGIGVWVVIHVWWNGRYGGEVDRLR